MRNVKRTDWRRIDQDSVVDESDVNVAGNVVGMMWVLVLALVAVPFLLVGLLVGVGAGWLTFADEGAVLAASIRALGATGMTYGLLGALLVVRRLLSG